MPSNQGKLVFVGLGLHDEDGITVSGLREIEHADAIFAELYTSSLKEGSLARLGERVGKKIEVMDRASLESGDHLLELSRNKRVALLVPGDSMAATTHVELRLRAIAQGTETSVVQGVSILTAIPGLLGLQHYKFGRTVTMPIPQEGYSPTSPYEQVADNLSRGLHSLVLLDIDAENERYMTANQGLNLLLDMGRRLNRQDISQNSLVCVVARAGAPDCVIRAGKLSEMSTLDFGPPLHAIVIPGALHFMETDALKVFAGLKEL